jgi:hypothetical protein
MRDGEYRDRHAEIPMNDPMGKTPILADCEIAKRGRSERLSEEGDGTEHPVVSLTRRYGCKILAEIGVDTGALASRVLLTFPDQVSEYHCVDPWVVYGEWADRPLWDYEKTQDHWEKKYEAVVRLASQFSKIRIHRTRSVDAAGLFADGYFDLIYLDDVHDFPNAINDIYVWLPKIKDNGILAGHDYYSRFIGYIRAVDFVFGQDHLVPESSISWYVELTGERKECYLRRIKERFGDPISMLVPENKQMFYRGMP